MSTEVGIRELKAKLSECVRRAAGGERIIVTDRGRPVAQLTPLDDATLDDMARIEQGVAEGWITPAKRRGGLGPVRPVPSSSGLTIAEIFDEDRGD
ncbi:type II toxin-antitoxin system Phd/YefM family antitoxin [Candidatus Poriferisodalis sp.]|uniref:type II toxin-antitoxin system Phd/YefM family antitoxin n=1 Tax=Candidatus Poriferisodalis sp. TaxID=3101277 RepID=UPI003B52F388